MLQTISVVEIFSLFLNKIKPQTALEIGCGTGGILSSLDIPCKIGVDTHEPSLEVAEMKYPSIIPIKYDILKLEDIFLPHTFDLVLGFDILEHFHIEEIPNIIEICERFSKKATVFWLPMEKTMSDNPYPENKGNEHRSLLTPALFNSREYEMIRFPHYWRNGRAETDIDGLLCFKPI